jgi:multiple sugar transport system permease protein
MTLIEKKRFSSTTKRKGIFLVPAGIYLGLMSVYPLFILIKMSLSKVTETTINQKWPGAGLLNYNEGIKSGQVTGALNRTLMFVTIVTLIGLTMGFFSAIALKNSGKFPTFLMAGMVFIWALPPVINGSVWKFLLSQNGLVNTIFHQFGMKSMPFLYNAHVALFFISLVNSWAVIPFNALVFRAAMLSIPDEILEASKIDGVNAWQEIKYITFPFLKPTGFVLTILTVVYAFRSFDFIYVMTFGGPGTSTNTLPYLSYNQSFARYNFGLGASTAILTLLIVFSLGIFYARTLLKEESD